MASSGAPNNKNIESKCWTIQHIYSESYDGDTFDKTMVYMTVSKAVEAVHETIDELDETIDEHGWLKNKPKLACDKSYITESRLNEMEIGSDITLFECHEFGWNLIVAVVARPFV